MMYTYKVVKGNTVDPIGMEFQEGVLLALHNSSSPWKDVSSTTQRPSVLFTIDAPVSPIYTMFQIHWDKPTDLENNWARQMNCEYGPYGQVDLWQGDSYYLRHQQEMQSYKNLPFSKGFFHCLRENYQFNDARTYGNAVGKMLDEIMFTEECMQLKEQPATEEFA